MQAYETLQNPVKRESYNIYLREALRAAVYGFTGKFSAVRNEYLGLWQASVTTFGNSDLAFLCWSALAS